MTPSPIRKVLSSMRKNGVAYLLMGGQACVVYGAAEFSRDIDLAISDTDENLRCLQLALDELQAENIAVPPFLRRFLESGLAIHFRCHHAEVESLRPLLNVFELDALAEALDEEERQERELDRQYWRPLREELERLRRKSRFLPG